MKKKNHVITIPVTLEEKKKVEEKALKYGLSVAAFVRHIILAGKIKINIESL